MSWLEGTRARLSLLFARRAVESRMEKEFRFHLEMETERLVREQGLDPQEARRRALVAFGGVEKHKEALRDDRGLAWLGGLGLDLKLGLRMLAKSPGLTLVGVLGMAVAVAIGAVSFVVIYTFVGTTVPLDEGDRLVVIQNVDARRGVEGNGTHLHDLAEWREALRAVDEFGAYRTVDRNLISAGAPTDPVRVAEMTASGFRIARVPALLGRAVHDDDERAGAPPVAVICWDMWQHRFGGARDIVGRTIQLGATTHTVIGVMPQSFAFPVNNCVWTPLRLDPARFERGAAPPIDVFGHLAPGATVDEAQAQVSAIGQRLAADYPASHEHVRPRVLPYALSFFDSPELVWAMHLAQLLVTMLLVVIGTNVATLVYARTASRAGEIAVRTALGASRRRVVTQLFAEAFVLSAAAAVVGLAAASLALRYIRVYAKRIAGEQIPFWMELDLSAGVVLYVAGLAVLGALIVGALPALKVTGRRVQANLQQLGAGMGGSGLRLGRTWTVLIVAQVATAVALLPVIVYAVASQWWGPEASGPAVSTRGWVTAPLRLDRDGWAPAPAADDGAFAARHVAVQAELVRRLDAEPRVADVVRISAGPGSEPTMRVEPDGAPPAASADSSAASAPAGRSTGVASVDREYFRAFGVPVLVGRALQPGDFAGAAPAVVVNRSFVQRVLGGGDALGRRVREVPERDGSGTADAMPGPWLEIVGVVPDFPEPRSASDIRPVLYRPMPPDAAPIVLAVRVRDAMPATFTDRLRELAVSVDPMLRLPEVRALDEVLSIERMLNRVLQLAVMLVTLSAVLLSAAGIYALMSFTIVRRRREIGVRAALGAGPRHVLGSVLARAARQIAIGIAVGTAVAAFVVHNLVGSGANGGLASARGVLVLFAVAALMAVVGLLAAVGPARRALRIQPTEALRADA